MTPGQLKNDSS